MKVITVGTLKGGTGKTSTIFNLSGVLSENNKILLIDIDPQCNLSLDVGIDVTIPNLKTVRNLFEGENIKVEELIVKKPMECLPNIDIICSNIRLTATELNIVNQAGREQILTNYLLDNKLVLHEYDYILIDTNPSMGILNQNAFLASDDIILISDISLNGIQGVELFIALWENTRKQLRKPDNIAALIINNYDKRLKLSGELLEYCHGNDDVKNILLNTIIPSSVKIKETELAHKPINVLYKNSNIHEAFINLTLELKERGVIL